MAFQVDFRVKNGSRFGHDFKCHLAPPPLGAWKIMKIRFENGTDIAALFKTAFEAIRMPPRRLLVLILDQIGLDFRARARPNFKMRVVFTMILSAMFTFPGPLGLGKS